MTIRSMPPASSHLADNPVPAPPPMIGVRAATLRRSCSRTVWRAMRGMISFVVGCGSACGAQRTGRRAGGDLAPGGDQRVGERLVVDVQRQPPERAVAAAAEVALDGLEQRAVR